MNYDFRTRPISFRTLGITLHEIEVAQLARRLDDLDVAYIFKHALVQETVYASLLKPARKLLHRQVAHALEEVNEKQLDEYAAALAHHFAEAEDDVKTLEYSLRAGDIAARVFANDEALAHYAGAIEIAHRATATSQQIIHLYQQRGRVLEMTGQYHEALASYEGLHDLAEKRQDRSLELASLMLRAPLHSAPLPTFNAELGKQLLLDALGTARELGDEQAEARILWNLSLLSVHTLHPGDGLMYGELSLALAEKLNWREQCAYTLHDLFIPYRSAGKIERAHEVQSQARQLFRELDNKPMLADNLGMSSQFAMYEGKLDQATEFAVEGLAISHTVGNPFGVFFNGQFLAIVYLERGEFSAALEVMQGQIEKLAPQFTPFNAVWTAAVVGLFYAQIGAAEASAEMERHARRLSMQEIPPMFHVGLVALLARIRVARDDPEQAAADIARGLPTIDLGGALQPGAVHMPLAQAELALYLSNFAQALEFLKPQAEWARTNEYHVLLPENLYLQGRSYMGCGEWEQAEATLHEARTLAEGMNLRRMLWQIFAALSEIERVCGNASSAESYQTQARSVLEFILGHTPPDLQEGFLNLPLVREVMA